MSTKRMEHYQNELACFGKIPFTWRVELQMNIEELPAFACSEETLCLTCGHSGKVRMILLDKGTFDPANVKKKKGKEIHFVRE